MKANLRFIQRVASSRLGLFLLAAHLIYIVYEFAHKPAATYSETPCALEPSSAAFIAGRTYHWHYESAPLKIISLLDLPGVVIGEFASKLFSPLKLCAFTATWVEAILILTVASLQWLVVGFVIESIFRRLWGWEAGALT